MKIVVEARPLIAKIIAEDPIAAKAARLVMQCIDSGWIALEF
jgi:hypothetical protein